MTSTEKYGSRCGGEDAELNHLPLQFPSDIERRKVTVYIHSYKGLSFGAIHWYAEVEEDDNAYVDHEDQSFRRPWGVWELPHLRGYKETCSVATKTEAQAVVLEILAERFTPETHYIYVRHNDPGEGQVYRDLGYEVDLMYPDKLRSQSEFVRQRMACRYRTTEGRD